jgi:uncharacterized protein (DUF885 family)
MRRRKGLYSLVFLCSISMPASVFGQTQAYTQETSRTRSSALLARIGEEYWQHTLSHNFFERFRSGAPVNELPDLSERKAKSDAAFANHILAELKKVNAAELPHEDLLTLKIMRWQANLDQEFAKYYWLDIQATAHSSPIPAVQRIFEDQRFRSTADLDHYLSLLEQYPAFIAGTRKMLQGEVQRGIVLPGEGIPGARRFSLITCKKPTRVLYLLPWNGSRR